MNGYTASYGSKGSVRPDYYRPGDSLDLFGSSIEVKNYDVTTDASLNRLIHKLNEQYQQRKIHLPQNTRQSSVIDIRGQGLIWEEAEQLGFKLRRNLDNDMAVILFIESENNG